MNAEAVVYALLTGAGDLTAIVGARIYPVAAPQGTQPPFVVYDKVSRWELNAVSLADPAMIFTRMQITWVTEASQHKQLVDIGKAVHGACANRLGLVAGVLDACVRIDGWGPDLFDAETDQFSQSLDVIVSHNQLD